MSPGFLNRSADHLQFFVVGAISLAAVQATDKALDLSSYWWALVAVTLVAGGLREFAAWRERVEVRARETEAKIDHAYDVALKDNEERDREAANRRLVAQQEEDRKRNEAAARAQEATEFAQYLDDAVEFCAAFRDALHKPGGGWINQSTGHCKPIVLKRRAPFSQPAARFLHDFQRVAAIVGEVDDESRLLIDSVTVPAKWQDLVNRHDDALSRGDAAWVRWAEWKATEVAELCREVRRTHGLSSRIPGEAPLPPP